jgi:hypothetical protein
MVEQERVELVVMLTRTHEDGVDIGSLDEPISWSRKSASSRTSESNIIEPYWPRRGEKLKIHANLSISVVEEKTLDNNTIIRKVALHRNLVILFSSSACV